LRAPSRAAVGPFRVPLTVPARMRAPSGCPTRSRDRFPRDGRDPAQDFKARRRRPTNRQGVRQGQPSRSSHDQGDRLRGEALVQPPEEIEFEREEAKAHEVEIEVLYCGVCHSDIHQVKNEWSNTVYPCVPGHEIVGRVTKVGPAVRKHAVGDMVGVGCMIDSCGQCEACKCGDQNYCMARTAGWPPTTARCSQEQSRRKHLRPRQHLRRLFQHAGGEGRLRAEDPGRR
jgi:hypothetical protein